MLQPTSRRLVAALFLTLSLWGSIGALGIGIVGLLSPPVEAQVLTPEQVARIQSTRGNTSGWAAALSGRSGVPANLIEAAISAGELPGVGGGGGGGGGGGLLGGLLGGDGGGILPLLLLILLLMQLFGGKGGSTPQKDSPVEEQPPIFPPSVGPQRTGPRSGTPPAGPVPQGVVPPAGILPAQPPLPVQPPIPAPLSIPPIVPPPSTISSQTMIFQIPAGAESAALSPNAVSIQTGSAVAVNNTATTAAPFTVRRAGQTTNLAQISVAAGTSHRIRFQNAGTFELVSGTRVLGTVTVK